MTGDIIGIGTGTLTTANTIANTTAGITTTGDYSYTQWDQPWGSVNIQPIYTYGGSGFFEFTTYGCCDYCSGTSNENLIISTLNISICKDCFKNAIRLLRSIKNSNRRIIEAVEDIKG